MYVCMLILHTSGTYCYTEINTNLYIQIVIKVKLFANFPNLECDEVIISLCAQLQTFKIKQIPKDHQLQTAKAKQ